MKVHFFEANGVYGNLRSLKRPENLQFKGNNSAPAGLKPDDTDQVEITTDSEPLILSGISKNIREMAPYKPGKSAKENGLKLSSNENCMIPPEIIQAVINALSEAFRYPDPTCSRLKGKIAETLAVHPDEIAVGPGSESLILDTIRLFMQPGDRAITGEGAFMMFEKHLTAHGGVLEKIPSLNLFDIPNSRFDIEKLIEATKQYNAKILYLPNPNNPTGTYFTHEELEKILKEVPKTTLVLLDEAYYEFCKDLPDYPKSLSLLKKNPNLLILRTFSKAHGLAGFRVGYGIGHNQLIEQLSKVKRTFEPTMISQVAAEVAWDAKEFVDKTVNNVHKELKGYYKILDKLRLKYIPSVGNFIFVKLPGADQANALCKALSQRGIEIRPTAQFGFPDAVRITVSPSSEENDKLFTALKEVKSEVGIEEPLESLELL